MKVFLVRHAEGEKAETHWQSPNSPLSEKGQKQSQALAATGRFKNIDCFYASPLVRAKQTVQSLTEKNIEALDGIREREQSSKIYGVERTNQISIDYWQDIVKHTDDWDWKWDEEEESKNEVLKRAVTFINLLVEKCNRQSVAVITHENFLRIFITQCIMGEDSSDLGFRKLYKSIGINNTGVSLLIYDETRKSWKISYLNDYSHGI